MRVLFCGLVLLLLAGRAGASLCSDPESEPAIRLGYGVYPEADIGRAGVVGEDSLFTDIDFSRGSWGLSHHYRAFEFGFEQTQTNRLQTNGDVHRLSARWQPRSDDSRWRLGVAPLLAVSSNLLKDPGAIGSDAWQVHGYAEYRHTIDSRWQFLFGACADDRFDHYRLYPLAGLLWQPRPGLRLRLAFPDSRLSLAFAPGWQLYLNAAPNGGAWQVYNEELDRLSRFRYRSWRLRLGALWQIGRHWQIGAEWGTDIERRFSFRRTAGDRLETGADDASYGALRLIRHW